jgi:hypothetical protein
VASWEYYSLAISITGSAEAVLADSVTSELGDLGREGWELVSVCPIVSGYAGALGNQPQTSQLLYVCKRPL